MQSKLCSALIYAAVAAVATPAIAAEPAGTWYLGVGVGESRAKIEDSTVGAALAGTGATATATSKDQHGLGYKAYAGYQFNRYFGLEGGYFNLGKFSFNSTTAPAGTLHGDLKNNAGYNLDAVGTVPVVPDKFSLYGRLGLQSSKTSDLFTGTGAASTVALAPSKNQFGYKAGLGLEFDFTKNIGMRGEWERYRISDGISGHANVDVFSLNMLYRF
jgi:OOP family OmpA-OmpF porin